MKRSLLMWCLLCIALLQGCRMDEQKKIRECVDDIDLPVSCITIRNDDTEWWFNDVNQRLFFKVDADIEEYEEELYASGWVGGPVNAYLFLSIAHTFGDLQTFCYQYKDSENVYWYYKDLHTEQTWKEIDGTEYNRASYVFGMIVPDEDAIVYVRVLN